MSRDLLKAGFYGRQTIKRQMLEVQALIESCEGKSVTHCGAEVYEASMVAGMLSLPSMLLSQDGQCRIVEGPSHLHHACTTGELGCVEEPMKSILKRMSLELL